MVYNDPCPIKSTYNITEPDNVDTGMRISIAQVAILRISMPSTLHNRTLDNSIISQYIQSKCQLLWPRVCYGILVP